MAKIISLISVISLLPGIAGAAGTTWVHGTDPTCGGNSPCYATLSLGIQNVDDGGTVIVLASAVDKIVDNHGKQNITVKGVNDSIVLTGNVNLAADEQAVGWTLQDLNFTLGIVIRNIANSITIDNVGAASIKLGDFDQDVNATITIRDVTMAQDVAANISIAAIDGADIAGSITIEDCVGIYAINIIADIGSANPATISANIGIRRNDVLKGGNVTIRGVDFAGSGSITGPIDFSDNVMSALIGKYGITLFGDVTGEITGPVTFDNNYGSWLAVLTTSTMAGEIGDLSFTNNTAEAIEIVGTGNIFGPFNAQNNHVIDLGGGTGLDNPLFLLDGAPLTADVVVETTTAPEGDIIVRSSSGSMTGVARIENNNAGLLSLDSRGGPMTQAFTVSGNTLPPADSPLSTMTIRSLNSGNSAGGSINNNATDRLTVNFGGVLTGDLTANSNIVRDQTTFISGGGPGAGSLTAWGNDFRGESYFDGMSSSVRFNRVADRMTVVAGATVDGRYNWWGCNAGPNEPGCSAASTNVFQYTPHLTFQSQITCIPPELSVMFDVREASDTAIPSGNITPGSISVMSTPGTVTGSPAKLTGGSGAATVTLPMGATSATITSQFDSSSSVTPWPCPSQIFADGFESGDTSPWDQLLAAFCSCLEPSPTGESFVSCLSAFVAPTYTRDQLDTWCAESEAEPRRRTED